MAVPVGRKTTTVLGRVCKSALPGAKSTIHDCFVFVNEISERVCCNDSCRFAG